MSLLNIFKSLNDEWFRNPMSRLEKSLRLPLLIKHGLLILFSRSFVFWAVFAAIVYLLIHNLTIAIFVGFFLAILWELLSLRAHFLHHILPRHSDNQNEVIKLSKQYKNQSDIELVHSIWRVADLSAWAITNIGYVGIAAWGWEIVFRLLYPLLVRQPKLPYYFLLVGFVNKTIEADQKLWEIARIKSDKNQKTALIKYLEIYGSRGDDIDLSLYTFREQAEFVESLIQSLSHVASPRSHQQQLAGERVKHLKQIELNLRVPRSLFMWLLFRTQQNVNLREDRRHYYFQPEYFLRQMIIELGRRKGIPSDQIFTHSWSELQ